MSSQTLTRSKKASGNQISKSRRVGNTLYHVLMLVIVLIWVLPLVWTFSLALTPNDVLKTNSQNLLPQGFTLANFVDVFATGGTPRWFLNSAIVTVVTTIVTVIVCAMAGYAFAKLPFAGRLVVYSLTLAGMMVPKEDRKSVV